MSHFAVIAPPFYSHLAALKALAQQLVLRGHRVTFLHQPDVAAGFHNSGIAFFSVGHDTHPPGSLSHTLRLAAHPGGLSVLNLIGEMARSTAMLCHSLPAALNYLAVDGVIADEMEPAGGLVAEGLGLPFISVACALPVNREPGLPLPVMPFEYATHERALQRYASSQRVFDLLMHRHHQVIRHYAALFGLPARQALHECLSPLAQISQLIPALDFPRQALPEYFHAVGPMRVAADDRITAPSAPHSHQVFASLGTLQGHRYALFKTIARACEALDVELHIAHCGGLNASQADKLRHLGAHDVVDFAQQHSALMHADAVITHGGLNTVMDAVETLTPMLVVPIAFDQPGVAARVIYHGVGKRVSRFSRSHTLASHLRELLDDPGFRQRMVTMRTQLRAAGGAKRAAQITEQALNSRRPVIKEEYHAASL